jgi:hypothetical protein
LKTWLAAFLMTASVIAAAECFWRSRGHHASVVDSRDLWAYHRGRIYDVQRPNVVLLGSSRMHSGISPVAIRDRIPQANVVQLAVSGSHCVAVLRDLADDERFVGSVICEVTPAWLCRKYWKTQQPYVDHYHRRASLDRELNVVVGQLFQTRLALLHPNLALPKVADSLLQDRRLPQSSFPVGHADRSITVDYIAALRRDDTPEKRAARLAIHREQMSEDRPWPQRWLADMQVVDTAVKKIQVRGGRVIFVRFPVSGELRQLEEELYPRRDYWDRFAALTSAETIHFADAPDLAHFVCPEDSHLDVRDVSAFTGSLIDELLRRRAFDDGQETQIATAHPNPR